MASYVYGSVPYGQYLQENAYVRDITGQIKKNGEATQYKISSQSREIVASNERLSQEFGAKFDTVNGTLESGFNRVENALGNVEVSIESLHSDFNYNIGLVLDQLQIQNQLTFGILERLDAIHKTLEHPELTKAREFYNRGCERLSKGLLDKALEALLKSEEIDDTDFFTQFQIGKLYLYGVDEDDDVIDLIKAEQHLRNAARYGKAEISSLPEFKKWTGEALLHASIACYALANEKKIEGNDIEAKDFLLKAFQIAQQACEIYPSLSESHYHLAKYSALLEDFDTSFQSLKKIIKTDANYSLKAESDKDFGKIPIQFRFSWFQLTCKIFPKNSQTQYYLAKYAARLGYDEMALENFEKALIDNLNYYNKSKSDQDFEHIRSKILILFEQIQKEKEEKQIENQIRMEQNFEIRLAKKQKAAKRILEQRKNYLTNWTYISDDGKKTKNDILKLISDAEHKIEMNTISATEDAMYSLENILILFKNLPKGSVIKKEDFIKNNQLEEKTVEPKPDGFCSICGAKLSFFDKLRGRLNCPKHS